MTIYYLLPHLTNESIRNRKYLREKLVCDSYQYIVYFHFVPYIPKELCLN